MSLFLEKLLIMGVVKWILKTYMGSSYIFSVIQTVSDEIVRLEPKCSDVSVFYKKGKTYQDLVTGNTLENPNHRIMKATIFANANEIDANKEYVLEEYLMCFKEIVKLFKWNIGENVTKKELLQIIRSDEFLSKCLKEEVKNEKSIWVRF